MERQELHLKEIRELAKRFTPDEIEGCIQSQLAEGANVCHNGGPTETVVGELAKAGFVRDMMEQGMPLKEAVRVLAERIRLVQRGYTGEE